MNSRGCDEIRDALPEWALGALDPAERATVEEHLSSCRDCSREEEVLRALLASRPQPPVDLEARIRARIREEMKGGGEIGAPEGGAGVIPLFRRGRWAPSWVLSAAAVVVLSLGIGVVWNDEDIPEVGQDPIQVVADEPLPEAWLWDNGVVAGAPLYDDLTDEQLEALIKELEG